MTAGPSAGAGSGVTTLKGAGADRVVGAGGGGGRGPPSVAGAAPRAGVAGLLRARRAHVSGARYTSSGNTVMATGSEISAVFCAAATMTLPRAPFSQYSRADEVALLVSQYSVMSSSTSSFVGDCWGSVPYVHCAKPGCTRIHPPRPAGESVRPYPTACGRAVIITK